MKTVRINKASLINEIEKIESTLSTLNCDQYGNYVDREFANSLIKQVEEKEELLYA